MAKWVWGLGSTGEYRAVDVSTILTTKNHVLQREREKNSVAAMEKKSGKKEQLRLVVHHIPSLTKVTKTNPRVFSARICETVHQW